MSGARRFEGCGTALVTPFDLDGGLDERALVGLVERQIEAGVDFLVPCGTTGESVTMSLDEQLRVVEVVAATAAGRLPVLAGAGGNNTARVIETARRMEPLAVDGFLCVTPYYNKPTQEGLHRHFTAIAESVGRPVVLYNVPGRTASNLLPETALELAAHDNIVGIKEASGDIVQISELAAGMPADFALLSGDDGNVLPLIAVGGCGVISVVSNVAPELMAGFTRACTEGRFAEARRQLPRLLRLTRALFVQTNPIPAKAALALMGLIEESYRLPLSPMPAPLRDELRGLLYAMDLLAGAAVSTPLQEDR